MALDFIRMHLTMTGANTYTERSIATAITPSHEHGQGVHVMEIMKIQWQYYPGTSDGDGVYDSTVKFYSTAAAVNLSHDSVIGKLYRSTSYIHAAGQSYDIIKDGIVEQCVGDGNGNGVLFVGDRMFFDMTTVGESAAGTVDIRVLFRWRIIPLTQYIAMIRSQSFL